MMRKILFALIFGLLACDNSQSTRLGPTVSSAASIEPEPNSCPMPKNVQWEVTFSPNGHTTDNIVNHIKAATKSIYVQAYSFTSQPIGEALVTMHNAGIHVEVIVDSSQKTAKGSVLPMLVSNGIKVYIDSKHAIAHNKVIILDGESVFTGSFNFTNAAERSNAENSIHLIDTKIASAYQKNWNVHRDHSMIQKQ